MTGTGSLDLLAARWQSQLEAWAIPEEVLAKAPASPWELSPEMFVRATDVALSQLEPTPSQHRALEALGRGGSVLDVGAGAGAASIPLAPPADRLVAVDERRAMLDAFAEAAGSRGLRHEEILGRWPDVAGSVAPASVVVCHHVLYNVAHLAPFLLALDAHAERRVVVELSDAHPHAGLNPLWRSIHGIERPGGPHAEDAAELGRALGLHVSVERWESPHRFGDAPPEERLAFTRRRLCVGPEHDETILAYLREQGDRPRTTVTLWWDQAG